MLLQDVLSPFMERKHWYEINNICCERFFTEKIADAKENIINDSSNKINKFVFERIEAEDLI